MAIHLLPLVCSDHLARCAARCPIQIVFCMLDQSGKPSHRCDMSFSACVSVLVFANAGDALSSTTSPLCERMAVAFTALRLRKLLAVFQRPWHNLHII